MRKRLLGIQVVSNNRERLTDRNRCQYASDGNIGGLFHVADG
jgi:hypothetical protein